MNNILTEDSIKLSYKLDKLSQNDTPEQIFSFTESELTSFVQNIIDSVVTPKINKLEFRMHELEENKVRPFIQDASNRMCDLEDKDVELHNLIKEQDIALEKVGAKAKGDLPDLADADLSTMGVRVKIVYSKLTKRGALCSKDIMNICKVKHYSQALEIMDAVIETYSDECYKGEGTFKGSKYWLTMNGFRGFQ